MSSAATSNSAAAAANKRFELPKLDFAFSSLTEGTNIPPPPESPAQEVPTPPKTPVGNSQKSKKEEEQAKSNDTVTTNATTNAGTKRPADDAPLSPAPSSRAGSIRRLFSRNLLNNAYAEGEAQQQQSNGAGAAAAANVNRPASRSNGSILDEKKAKRGSGFFRRFRTNEPAPSSAASNRATIYDNAGGNQSKSDVRKPPPPMIPELSALESKVDVGDSGSLGSDLFKNIK